MGWLSWVEGFRSRAVVEEDTQTLTGFHSHRNANWALLRLWVLVGTSIFRNGGLRELAPLASEGHAVSG